MEDQNKENPKTDKTCKEIESRSFRVLDDLSYLFPKERTITAPEGLKDVGYAYTEIMNPTKSPHEKVTIAVYSAREYAIRASKYCTSENKYLALTYITEAKFYLGIACGIKSTIDDGTDYGAIQKGTTRAKERARLGGIKKEENQKKRRQSIINILLIAQPPKPWKNPREAAEKIASKVHKVLHDNNIPLTNIDTLEKLIIKLINNDDEVYKAYNPSSSTLN